MPADEQITVTHNLSLEKGKVSLVIYDAMGREVFETIIQAMQQIVNVKALHAGVYFYTVSQNNTVIFSNKLMKK